jgi:hypothetical protein
MNPKQVSQTILSQLGGGRFTVMTGAKNFAYSNDGTLSFRIGKNAAGFTHVKIALNGLDLYDMTFIKIRKYDIVKKETVNNIYCDQLRDIFEDRTGMYTSL